MLPSSSDIEKRLLWSASAGSVIETTAASGYVARTASSWVSQVLVVAAAWASAGTSTRIRSACSSGSSWKRNR